MGVAACAQRLVAAHEEAAVLFLRDRAGRDRLEEAGPAGAAVELRLGAEQRVAAAGADIGALVLAGVVLTGEGALGPLEAADAELFRRQQIGSASCRDSV